MNNESKTMPSNAIRTVCRQVHWPMEVGDACVDQSLAAAASQTHHAIISTQYWLLTVINN